MKRYAIIPLFMVTVFSVSFAADKSFLGDRHEKEYGVECAGCHTETPPAKAVEFTKCFECHESYAALSERTKKSNPNPHNNHMVYEDTNCGECHRSHKPPTLTCDGCHEFDLNIR